MNWQSSASNYPPGVTQYDHDRAFNGPDPTCERCGFGLDEDGKCDDCGECGCCPLGHDDADICDECDGCSECGTCYCDEDDEWEDEA